jgi:hypothetical protein
VAERHTLHLARGKLNEAKGPAEALPIASPQTTGIDGGEFCVIWLGPEFPGDQRRDDAGSLTFDSGKLGEDIEIVGAPEVHLTFASDRPVAFVAARLNDLRPDGSVARITYTIKNLCQRASAEHPSPLKPGEKTTVTLKLDDIAFRLPKGHTLRLSLSTCYWPMMWPAPEPVTLTVFAGESSLVVPIRRPSAADVEPRFPEAVAAPALEQVVLREGSNRSDTTVDPATGRVTIDIADDFGKTKIRSHGLIAGSIGRETHSILPGDPLSARMTTHWTEELERDDGPWAGWRVRTETTSEMTATATHFHLRARIEAWAGDDLVFVREFDETIPRNLN